MSTLIELKEVTKSYTNGAFITPVLKNISLTIQQGEFVSLRGSSGSGKSTLMNIIGCLDQPTAGQYWLTGVNVSQLSSNQRARIRSEKIGFIFQNFNLLNRTSTLDNVLMPLAYARHSSTAPNGASNIETATSILTKLGLGDRLRNFPSQLSGGQQQRVAIARALINQPSIILADEPTGNLDSQTSAEVLELLQDLNRSRGVSIILVTHDADVAKYANRTIVIKDGLIDGSRVSSEIGIGQTETKI